MAQKCINQSKTSIFCLSFLSNSTAFSGRSTLGRPSPSSAPRCSSSWPWLPNRAAPPRCARLTGRSSRGSSGSSWRPGTWGLWDMVSGDFRGMWGFLPGDFLVIVQWLILLVILVIFCWSDVDEWWWSFARCLNYCLVLYDDWWGELGWFFGRWGWEDEL